MTTGWSFTKLLRYKSQREGRDVPGNKSMYGLLKSLHSLTKGLTGDRRASAIDAFSSAHNTPFR